MRRSSRRRIPILGGLLLAGAVASMGPVHAKAYMTADFKLGETRPRTLALLPPHADFIKAKAVMTDEMINEATALEDHAVETIVQAFEARGYSVRRLAPQDLEADPGLQDLVRRVNSRYAEEWGKVVRRPKRVKLKRYSAGDESRELATMLGVDGLILARIQAVYVTAGKKAMSFFFGGTMTSYARVDLAAVDGETGSVESYFTGIQTCKSKHLTEKPGQVMQRAYARCLKKYPAEGVVLKIKPGEAEMIAEDEGDEDEEVVLGELEVLLGADTESDEEEEDEPED